MRVERVEIVLDQSTNVMDFPLDLGDPAPLLIHLLHDLVVELVDIVEFGQWRLFPFGYKLFQNKVHTP